MGKVLPLLSDGLREIILSVAKKHEGCTIAQTLIDADNLVSVYKFYEGTWPDEKNKSILNTLELQINSIITNEARMLGYRKDVFEISYLPEGKEPIYSSDGIWSRENRITAKPSRIIQKLLKQEFKCKEFEDFGNWLKAEMLESGNFVILTGSDITKYYCEDNYTRVSGTLGNSCMRYSRCENFFKVYEDHAKMLVCMKDGQIMGRAILWEYDGKTFMDRVYVCYDYLYSQFIEYAENHKWIHRRSNELLHDGDTVCWVTPDSNYKIEKTIHITIQLSEHYESMPYMDSLRYYDPEKMVLSTNPDLGRCALSYTDGSYEENENRYICDHCGTIGYGYDDECPDDWAYSNYLEIWLCPDCQQYCDGLDDYVSVDTPTVLVKMADGTFCYPLDYVQNDEDFTEIDGKWYDVDYEKVRYDDINNVYYLEDE